MSEEKYVYRAPKGAEKDTRSTGEKYVYRAPKNAKEELGDVDDKGKFVQLLKELAEVRFVIAQIDAQRAMRRGKETIESNINAMRDQLEAQAKRFGTTLSKAESQYLKNADAKESILAEVEKVLDQLDAEYEPALQDKLAEISELEAEEQQIMYEQKENKISTKYAKKDFQKSEKEMREDIKLAIDDGDLDLAAQLIEELQDYRANNDYNDLKVENVALEARRQEIAKEIERCEREYESLLDQRDADISTAMDYRDYSLSLIPKQNIFQKTVGALFNRFNGTKKFVKGFMEPLQKKVTDLRENKLPQIKETIAERREQFADSLAQSRAQIEKTVADKVTDYSSRLVDLQEKAVVSSIEFAYGVSDALQTAMDKAKDNRDKIIDGAKNVGRATVEGAVMAGYAIADGVTMAKDAVVDNATKAGKTILTVGGNIVKSVKDNVNLGISKGKQTYRSVIQKGYDLKLSFIDRLQNELSASREELVQKRDMLNNEKDGREGQDTVENDQDMDLDD